MSSEYILNYKRDNFLEARVKYVYETSEVSNYHSGFKNHQFSFMFTHTLSAFLTQSAPSSLSESLLSPKTASRGWSGPWFIFFGAKSPYL